MADEVRGLGRLLARPAFEVFPMQGIEDGMGALPAGATVTVTCSRTRGIDATLALSEHLATRGFRVVPHISARLVASDAHLERIVERLRGLGSNDVFVIGGDSAQPAGRFSSAADLITALADLGPSLRIGIAGYPEGHPLIEDERLLQALEQKQAIASYVVTQMCFDPRAVLGWIERVRDRGIGLPVHIGVPGAVKTRRLLRFSLRVGVGDSMRFLTKHGRLMARLTRPGGYSPDALIEGLASHLADPVLGIRGFHLYTFNEIAATEAWRRSMLASVQQSKEEEVHAHTV